MSKTENRGAVVADMQRKKRIENIARVREFYRDNAFTKPRDAAKSLGISYASLLSYIRELREQEAN